MLHRKWVGIRQPIGEQYLVVSLGPNPLLGVVETGGEFHGIEYRGLAVANYAVVDGHIEPGDYLDSNPHSVLLLDVTSLFSPMMLSILESLGK